MLGTYVDVATQIALIARPTNAQVVQCLRSQNRSGGPGCAWFAMRVALGFCCWCPEVC